MVTPDKALQLLDEAGCSDDVQEHAAAVLDLAMAMARRTAVDEDVVAAGALLHDVGRGFSHGPDHVPKGVAFLQDAGVDDRIVACVARHMGAGVSAEEAEELGWPKGTWTPQRMEEKIVAHADNLTGGTDYRDLDRVIAELETDGHEDLVPRMRLLHEELADALHEEPSTIARQLRT
jgi:uncharacterized protein (TIGR00295 family)